MGQKIGKVFAEEDAAHSHLRPPEPIQQLGSFQEVLEKAMRKETGRGFVKKPKKNPKIPLTRFDTFKT